MLMTSPKTKFTPKAIVIAMGMLNAKAIIIAVAIGFITLTAVPNALAAELPAELPAIAIGDSVMLGAKSQLEKMGVAKVDAKVSRQASSGPELVKKLASKPNVKFVVVHLGTNGSYSVETCRETVLAAGLNRTVFLVNLKVPRKWEELNNALMKKCAEGFSASRVQVLDWHAIAQKRGGLLYSDGYHLTPAGARRFASMVTVAIKEVLLLEGRVSPGDR